MSISEIVTRSGIDIRELDADHIEIKREDRSDHYFYGMIDKTKSKVHGIVRSVYKSSGILEGMF